MGGTFMEQTGHIKQDMRHFIRHGSLYRDKNSIHDKGHYTWQGTLYRHILLYSHGTLYERSDIILGIFQ